MSNLPNIKWSRLLLGRNSYTSSRSFCCKQKPRSLTKFRCWSVTINCTSFLNSMSPWLESLDNLFTAISFTLESFPWKWLTSVKIWPGCCVHRNVSFISVYLVNWSKSSFSKLVCIREVISGNFDGVKLELYWLNRLIIFSLT